MKIIQWIKFFWMKARKEVEKYPVIKTHLDELMKSKIRNKIKTDTCYGYECTDLMYFTCDYETAKLIAKTIPIKYRKYVKTEHDCENFAIEFYALCKTLFPYLPVGYCKVNTSKGKHALNWIAYKTKSGRLSFDFIEPQTGELMYYDYKPYYLEV